MLSATPHDGRARSFASLMNMLDATAIADPDSYTKEDFRDKGLVRRCFPAPPPASRASTSASGEVEKELAESPNAPVAAEVESLQVLREALEAIGPDDYAKYRALLAAVRGGKPFDWTGSDPQDRLVVFTERIETLKWLRDRLSKDLRLSDKHVEILHGGLSDVDQQRVVEDFGNAARPLRLLICSDVASEGINLHYQCHRLIHFDMPWSLMVFPATQRTTSWRCFSAPRVPRRGRRPRRRSCPRLRRRCSRAISPTAKRPCTGCGRRTACCGSRAM